MLLKQTAWLRTMTCRFHKELQVIFPDKWKVVRRVLLFGDLISLGKLVYFFFKIDASMHKDPDAIFEHESVFTRFNTANKKFFYGQNLTKNQENVITYLKGEGLGESQIFSLFLGRYIKPKGNIVVNAKLEIFLILLILFLVSLVLMLLVGLAYDLLFYTAGSAGLRLFAWMFVAVITVIPTAYFSLLLLKPPVTYYRCRTHLAQVGVISSITPSKAINLHDRH